MAAFAACMYLCAFVLSGQAWLSSADRGQSVSDFDEDVANVQRFLKLSPTNETYFDAAAAKADGVSDMIWEAGQVAAAYSSLTMERSYKQFASQRIRPPRIDVWGNWCGPGNTGGKVKDLLDAQCKKHDKCYSRRKYLSCKCDFRLIVDIQKNIRRITGRAYFKAVGISAALKLGLSNPIGAIRCAFSP